MASAVFALVAAVASLSGDTWLGRALNEPLFKKVTEENVDAAGTEYGTSERLVPAAGVAVIVGYNALGALARPRLEAAARERREQRESEQEEQ